MTILNPIEKGFQSDCISRVIKPYILEMTIFQSINVTACFKLCGSLPNHQESWGLFQHKDVILLV